MSTPTAVPGVQPDAEPDGIAPMTEQPASRSTLRRIFRRPSVAIALGFVVLMFIVAILGDLLAPYDPDDKDFRAMLQGPSSEHWFGTDAFGQDVFSRLVAGTQVAFVVSLGSVALAALIGVPLGLLLGYKGGWWDRVGSRAIDISDALPGMLVAFAVISALGRSVPSIVVAIALVFALALARMARAVTLAERQKEYVDAAHVSGLSGPEILFAQILPNLIAPLTAQASLMMGSAILIESTLSFLGVGVQGPSWGGVLADASQEISQHPAMLLPPGLAIVAAVLSFNLVANGVSDVLGGTSGGVISRASRRRALATPRQPESLPPNDHPPVEPAMLEVRGVTVGLHRPDGGPVAIVENAWLTVKKGEVVGLLGESGSGKSMLAKAVLGFLPHPTFLAGGAVLLDGVDIAGLSEREMRKLRGNKIAAVFQNPSSALSPVHTIGRQLCEPLRIHLGMNKREALDRAAELLDQVGVENAASRLDDYPHQFSGGMAQRVAIAMALAAGPELIIADEATSALDVTTQAQVLDLLLGLRESMGLAILMITHDLGVVAETCDRAAVMYAGQIVEVNDVATLFDRPRHPYTAALLEANPALDHHSVGRRPVIGGRVPPPGEWPHGCHFAARCSFVAPSCSQQAVPMIDGVRCVRTDEFVNEVVAQ